MNPRPGQPAQPTHAAPEQRERLATAALKNFRVIIRSVKKHQRRIEHDCAISGAQLWALWELHRAPGLKVSALADRLAIHQSTASNLIEKLARKALVERRREDQDQRVVRLYLTPAGRQVIRRAPGSPRGVLKDALDELPLEVLTRLQQTLALLTDQIRLKDEGDGMEPLTDL